MDPITLIVLAIIGLAGAGASAGVSAYNNAKNIEYQTATNAKNIEFQKEVNAQNQYNLEHQHQIEMADLQAAGLNPVLTATGGSGAGQAYLNAPQAKAPQMDLSGVSNALSGLTHMSTSAMMMKMISDNNAARNATLSAIANSKNAQSAANAALRAETAIKKTRMGNIFADYNLSHQRGQSAINSARSWDSAYKDKDLQELIRIAKIPWVKK